MLSKNNKIEELENQVKLLKEELEKKEKLCSDTQKELDELLENRENEEKSILALKSSFMEKLNVLDQEILEEKQRTKNEMNAKLELYSKNFNYYLSQIQLMIDILINSAKATASEFLLSDININELFKENMEKFEKDAEKEFDQRHGKEMKL